MLLVVLAVLTACAPDPLAAPDDTAVLPAPESSFVFGPNGDWTGGQVVVGLLLNRPERVRLAELVPENELEAYLEADARGEADLAEHPVAEDVGIDAPEPRYMLWGRRADELAAVAQRVRDETNVRIVFREILASEAEDVPLVFVSRWMLNSNEKDALAAYEQHGGTVLRRREDVDFRDALRLSLPGVLMNSPKIYRLPVDPLEMVRAAREGDDLTLHFRGRPSTVWLEDAQGAVVADADSTVTGHVLAAADRERNPYAHRVVARFRDGDFDYVRSWSVAELVGTPSRQVEAAAEARAGTTFAMRLRVLNSKTDRRVEGDVGTIELRMKGDIVASTTYETDAAGEAEPVLEIPATVPPGSAELLLLGEPMGAVRVRADARISLVTDRTLYKENDSIHARVMVHRAGDGRPLADKRVEIEFGGAKKTVTTSAHGIASTLFTLRDAAVGTKRIAARAEGAKASRKVRVRAFERPTFTVALEPSVLVLAKGEEAPIVARATYVNGKPVVGARVVIAEGQATVGPAQGTTDENGEFRFTVGDVRRRSSHHIDVVDADGRAARVVLHSEPPATHSNVVVRALTDAVWGVATTLAVDGQPGQSVELVVDGDERTITLDDAGYAEVVAAPKDGALSIVAGGKTTRFAVLPRGTRPILVLSRRTGRVGGALKGVVVGPPGRTYIDVLRDGLLVRTTHLDLPATGEAAFSLALDDGLAGLLTLRVQHRGEETIGTSAHALVTRGRSLRIDARAQQSFHRPGSSARVDITVTDGRGAPTACVLGYWGVDEALIALPQGDIGEGFEDVFDVLPARPGDAAGNAASRVERSVAPPHLSAEGAIGLPGIDPQVDGEVYAITAVHAANLKARAVAARRRVHGDRLAALRDAYVNAWNDVALADIPWLWTMREGLDWLVSLGHLPSSTLLDAWDTPLRVWHDIRGYRYEIQSAGPDREWGTPDDGGSEWDGWTLYAALPGRIRAFHEFVREHRTNRAIEAGEWPTDLDDIFAYELDSDLPFEESFGLAAGLSDAPFEGPMNNGTIGIGGSAGGAWSGRGGAAGGRKRSESVPSVHVRRDFDPTLCFVPEAIVGPDGRTRLEIALKDQITTWRLRLVASRHDGATGIGQGRIRSGLPLYATPWLASRLTVGDTLDLPVAIRNEQEEGVEAAVTITMQPGLELLGDANAAVFVGAGRTGSHTYRVRAVAPGVATVKIAVRDGMHADVQERIVRIRPHARKVVAVKSLTLTQGVAALPDLPAQGTGDLRLDLYPTPLTETLSGFDGLIACPHG